MTTNHAARWVPAGEHEAMRRRLHLAAVLLEHSADVKARDAAMLDQRDAALEELSRQHRGAWREVERLRRVCREHGVEWREGVR